MSTESSPTHRTIYNLESFHIIWPQLDENLKPKGQFQITLNWDDGTSEQLAGPAAAQYWNELSATRRSAF